MKAKCINASGSQGRLTKGKVYDVERSKGLHRYYTLTDDTGHTLSVPSWRFKETSNIDKLIMAAIDRIASDHTQFYKGNIGHATCVAIESEMRALLAAAGLNESEPIKEAKAKTYVRFEYGQEDHGPRTI